MASQIEFDRGPGMAPSDPPNGPVAPEPGADGPRTQVPLEAVVQQTVSKIQEQPLLFVIAIAALLIAFGILASGLGSSSLGLITVIIGILSFVAILGYYVQLRRQPPPSSRDTRGGVIAPVGVIEEPPPNSTVSSKILCTGTASNLGPNKHLWLAVEANGFVWPKEGEVHAQENSRWVTRIYEEGATQRFRLSLLLASPEAHERIVQWLEAGRATGEYVPMRGIPGTERLDLVDGLRLAKSR